MKREAFLLKVRWFCGIVWLCTYPAMFLLLIFIGGDLTNFNSALEQPHVTQEMYLFAKWVFNIVFDLHIMTALPAMFEMMDAGKREHERKLEKMRTEIDKSTNNV